MNCPLTKQQFVHYINFMKERWEAEQKLNEAFSEEFEDSIFYPYSRYETELLHLLQTAMQDAESDSAIDYFIYELDFGERDIAKEAIEEADGTVVPLTTPEELYDYLVKEHFSE